MYLNLIEVLRYNSEPWKQARIINVDTYQYVWKIQARKKKNKKIS